MGSIKKIKMRNSIYDLEDARLEIGSVTATPSFNGKQGVGFTTNSTPYAFLLRDFTSEVFGNNTQVIEWSHTHNMNDYKDAGTYRIKGERTGNPMDDNLPIMNQGSGHTIEGILYVLDSSLANGSGKQDDCTITQFLMLSNRVGGQEGDMYMRSAYGANKDNLTWKPWEKYQTNMEVGCVSDYKLLNPNNPTEILKQDSGMNHIIDNGIYSGIYFGPKCMVGTGEDNWHINFQDATAIETFVMVVINNYLAADDAKSVTQIKFAVTNGGVFSMEKRVANRFYNGVDGVTNGAFSQWESVGGGGSSNIDSGVYAKFDNSTLKIGTDPNYQNGTIKFGESVVIGNSAKIGADVKIATGITIGTASAGGGVSFSGSIGSVNIGKGVNIGDNVIISDVAITEDCLLTRGLTYEIRSRTETGDSTLEIAPNALVYDTIFYEDSGTNRGRTTIDSNRLKISHEIMAPDETPAETTSMLICDEAIYFDLGFNSDTHNTTTIPWGLLIYSTDDKLVFEIDGKTAELPLT